ncbi:MAG: 3'-5' exonuclease [Flavobacteriales bacterium]|nr:3'-5' exonuclease [Flavobacteriales bacterium]
MSDILKLERPIVFFDIESTGLSPQHDRIVEIAFIKLFPDYTEHRCSYRLNPTIPISPEAISVHGITNKDVENEPTFSDLAQELLSIIEDADLAGFNALKFDIPMLTEEFMRCGIDFDLSKKHLVDVQLIFHKMEERTLSAAYRFYCDKALENAHSAEADTQATYEVFLNQVKRYDELKTNVEAISIFTGLSKRADLEGRIVFDAEGCEIFNFGKHKGKRVEDVFSTEPSYYNWMMNGDFASYTKKVISDIKMRMLKNKFR